MRAYTPPRLDYGDSAHTTSMPDTLGTLINRTLASFPVRTGEVSRESSDLNLDHGYGWPMTDPLGLRTGDRTLPKPSSPDSYPDLSGLNKYPGVASVESPQNLLPSPGLQQKTDYPSAIEDPENYNGLWHEYAPGSLRDGTPASGRVRIGEVSREYSNSNTDQWSNRRPVTNAFENGMDLPKLPPPLSSGLKFCWTPPDAGTPVDLLGRYYSDRDQSFPMAASMLPEYDDPFSMYKQIQP